MENPYKPPNAPPRREFKTPMAWLLMLGVGLGFILALYFGGTPKSFHILVGISFEVFLVCSACHMAIIVYGKKSLDQYLAKYSVIDTQRAIDALKPIIRSNMYLALLSGTIAVLGGMAGVVAAVSQGPVKMAIVVGVLLLSRRVVSWYAKSEECVKQIECRDPSLEAETSRLLTCWINRVLPNF